MQNNVKTKFKKSKLDVITGYFVYYTFIIQMAMCLFISLFHVVYLMMYKEDFKHWIDYNKGKMFELFLVKLCNWILILG